MKEERAKELLKDQFLKIGIIVFITGGIGVFVNSAHSKPGIVAIGACKAAQESATQQCRIEYENKWYNAGATTYMRSEHLKDIPLCNRVGEAALLACNRYGKE